MARSKKEQMQLVILGAAVAAVALFAGVYFLLAPLLKTWKQDVAQAVEIRAKLDEARAVVRSRADILDQMAEERGRLRGIAQHIPLPVLGNYLLGMDADVRELAAGSALEIKSVMDSEALPINFADQLCRVYGVRVAAEGNYNDLTGFLSRLEAAHPLVTVSALNITAQPGKPNRHDIRMVLDWLVWVKPDQLPEYVVGAEIPDAD